MNFVSESNDPLALRREDLAGLVESYRHQMLGKWEWAGVAAAIGGLAVGPILMSVRARAGWPTPLDPVFFGLGWVIFLGMGTVVIVRARRMRARYQICCPQCDVSLLGPRSRHGDFTYSEMAIESGCCPSCDAHILAP